MNIIFIDRRMPEPAKKKLSGYGDIIEFAAPGLAYPSISGHPDVFLAQLGETIIFAPNIPEEYPELLKSNGIRVVRGELPVGDRYPETARYNVVATDSYLIHNFRHTDSVITDMAGDRDLIHINQGYVRCNLMALKEDHFITSDEGLFKVLSYYGKEVLLVSPGGILLEGHKNGFFGGACGVERDKFFTTGSLKHFGDGNKVRGFLEKLGYEIVELYDGPLFDGGGIFILSK